MRRRRSPARWVQTQREWLESLSNHEPVLARYAMRSQADVSEDNERQRRQSREYDLKEALAAERQLYREREARGAGSPEAITSRKRES
jgi:hypothetical protein